MLICNNCHHVNEDHTTQCAHCHMPDNFTYRKEGERKSDELSKSVDQASCMNCGNAAPGDGDRCIHCNFPRPLPVTVSRRDENKALDYNLETNVP